MFRDVAPTSPWYDGVVFAVEHGISQGTGEDTFSPDDPITTRQWAVMLCRTYGLDVETPPDTPFGEVELSQAYREGWLDYGRDAPPGYQDVPLRSVRQRLCGGGCSGLPL